MPNQNQLYLLLADAVLILHLLFILFVIGGLLLILAGYWRRWDWVRNPWFRLAHLAAIGIVVAQVLLGVSCPLTVWESDLRRLAGSAGYEAGFIETWVHWLIFYQGETWVFGLAYVSFGLLVLLVMFLVPPRWRRLWRAGQERP